MRTLTIRMLALAALLAGVVPSQVFAQATALPGQEPAPPPAPQAPGQATGATFCGVSVPPPANLPPDNSGPVVWQMGPCFSAQGNAYTVEPQTYLYYMQLRPSQPSQNLWVPYNEQTEQTIREDFHRLWNTNFL